MNKELKAYSLQTGKYIPDVEDIPLYRYVRSVTMYMKKSSSENLVPIKVLKPDRKTGYFAKRYKPEPIKKGEFFEFFNDPIPLFMIDPDIEFFIGIEFAKPCTQLLNNMIEVGIIYSAVSNDVRAQVSRSCSPFSSTCYDK